VTGGISEYPEALLMLGWEPPSTERQNCGFGGLDVVDPYVEVELLRITGVRPARGNPFRRALKRKLACAWLTTDDHPVAGVLVYFHAQHVGVERRERAGVRAVQHGLFQSADHLDSVSDRRRHTFGQRHERAIACRDVHKCYGCRARWLPITPEHHDWMIHQVGGRLSSAVLLG